MKTKLFLFIAVLFSAFCTNAQSVPVNIADRISITGEAQGGWGDGYEVDMLTSDNVNWTLSGLNTTAAAVNGGLKFRKGHVWEPNTTQVWGGAAFPSGIATQPGDNIVCTLGTWIVNFNSTTGAYSFTPDIPPAIVRLVGSAAPGGAITMNPGAAGLYSLSTTTFTTGTLQVELAGAISPGGTSFPTGDILSGTSIPVTAGIYSSVTYNNDTGVYVFTLAPLYRVIGLIGSGTTGTGAGWSQDVAKLTTSNGVKYKLGAQQLYSVRTDDGTPGEVKFRENDNWNIPSFGGVNFPSGPSATNAGDNIVVTNSGIFNVFFNVDTKAYYFLKQGTISIVGDAVGGWPDSTGNPGPVDVNLMTTTDNENYTFSNLAVVAGPLKFREDANWDIPSFGGILLASGNSNEPGADNIVATVADAGTYNVTWRRSTKAYVFTRVNLANTTFETAGFKVAPNPTQNTWNFSSTKDAIVSIQVVDILGKVIVNINNTIVDASSLNSGVYFAKVTTANATATVKLVKN